ncbi:TPA: hypothetical protein U3L57_000120 [Streptococcus agalactiae]|nr:hypothetical protein [Streptococcus agalactiae]
MLGISACILVILTFIYIYLTYNEKINDETTRLRIAKNAQVIGSPKNLNPDEAEYYALLLGSPRYDQYNNMTNNKYYNDSVETTENFKLRELLLLIWWGKKKNGRRLDSSIPTYFEENYNLDVYSLTEKFIDKAWLMEADGIVSMTDKGHAIYKKYYKLWEIHSFKGAITNLDFEFPNWNLNCSTKLYLQRQINYLNDENKYYKQMIQFLSRSKYPEDGSVRRKDIKQYFEWIDRNLVKINDIKIKIEMLEEL